jgi:perosamine synthetase
VRHALAACNGTAALHLAVVGLGIGPGDEVIVPTLTYVASANTVAYAGAVPVFADCTAATWQIDPGRIADCITPRTKAIMVVHIYGQPCDMDAILDIAHRHRLLVIEDCAEAFGASHKGKPAGTLGHVSAFSFFGNKTITTGEGGMIVSNDEELIDRCRRLRGQGLAARARR